MKHFPTAQRCAIALLILLLAAVPLTAFATPLVGAAVTGYPSFADPAFGSIWDRYDHPVFSGDTSRSYIWGGADTQGMMEPYAQGPNGQHLVQYFDKARMEINAPGTNPASPYYVTTGLLAEDMILGRIQTGDSSFQQATPAAIPFGDLDDTQTSSPTYASFAALLTAPPVPAGQPIVATLDRTGNVSTNADSLGVTSAGVINGVTTNHSIASVFLAFLQTVGPVYQGNQDVNAPIFDPLFYVTGYPITEAYWATVKAGGVNKVVLLQCFERRCLSYTPSNEPAFQVELANTGLQYYNWRYATPTPSPSPSPSPSPTTIPAPTITNLSVGNVTPAGATITWETGQPATSEIDYGTTDQYGQVMLDNNLVTSHTVTLSDLQAATGYSFRAVSTNANGARVASANQAFTTASLPGPTISTVDVATTATTATFQFTTAPDTTAQLTYELPGNGASALTYTESGFSADHNITIGDLAPSTTYTYTVVATAADGSQTTLADVPFTTADPAPVPPTIGPVTVIPQTTSAQLAFTTSPAATVEIIYHVTSGSGSALVINDRALSATHTATLSNLSPNTEYTYRIVATTPDGLQTTGDAATFTTREPAPVAPHIGTPTIIVDQISAPTITITFTTDPAARAEMSYHTAANAAHPTLLIETGSLKTSHQFVLNNVQPGSSYTFHIIATAPDGTEATSQDYTVVVPDNAVG